MSGHSGLPPAVQRFLGVVALAGACASIAATPAESRAEKPWTILIYGACDNNADGHMLEFLNGIRRAVADDPGLELVVFIDRSTGYSTDAKTFGEDFTGARLYRVTATTAERLAGGEEFPEIALEKEWEADSADPACLRKFLRFGKARFPARHYALLIYSHADGITMCPDEATRTEMGIAQLSSQLEDKDAVDFTALELCNMGGVEIAYQWRPGNGGFSTEVLAAIPNAGPPLDWHRIFERIHSPGHPAAKERDDCIDPAELTAQEFGRLTVEEGGKGRLALVEAQPQHRDRAARESVGAYDLFAVEEAKAAVDRFAVAAAAAGGSAKALLRELRGPGPRGTVMNYVGEQELAGPRPYVDLHDLMQRAAGCEELPEEVRAAAQEAADAVDEMVIASFGMHAYERFEPGKSGVFIVFPAAGAAAAGPSLLRARDRDCFEWYAPFEIRREGTIVGAWDFCRDGAEPGNGVVENWYELLDSWRQDDAGER